VYLPESLIGVKRSTIQNIGGLGSQLTFLEVTGHATIPDRVFAGALSSLPSLEHLNLRYVLAFLSYLLLTLGVQGLLPRGIRLRESAWIPRRAPQSSQLEYDSGARPGPCTSPESSSQP
jgi:hypothetical protein